MNDEYFMQQALKEARKAYESDEIPIGAVIVIGERIIARGYNQTEKLTDCTAHAEIIALTSAFNFLGSKYLPDATIYITVEPCLMCAGALYWSKISRVVFGAEDEKNGYRRGITGITGASRAAHPGADDAANHAEAEKWAHLAPPGPLPSGNSPADPDTNPAENGITAMASWPFHPKTVLTSGILREDCARLIQDFFRAKR